MMILGESDESVEDEILYPAYKRCKRPPPP